MVTKCCVLANALIKCVRNPKLVFISFSQRKDCNKNGLNSPENKSLSIQTKVSFVHRILLQKIFNLMSNGIQHSGINHILVKAWWRRTFHCYLSYEHSSSSLEPRRSCYRHPPTWTLVFLILFSYLVWPFCSKAFCGRSSALLIMCQRSAVCWSSQHWWHSDCQPLFQVRNYTFTCTHRPEPSSSLLVNTQVLLPYSNNHQHQNGSTDISTHI
jgi:hypothetical protein